MKKAVFFDRDGTLIFDKEYMFKPEDLELVSGAKEALAALKKAGFGLFILSNQSGVPRGYFTLEQAEAFNGCFIDALGLGGGVFDGVCLAIEPPDATDGYRKPSPKYVLEQMQKYALSPENVWVVGDRKSDWQTALNAHCNAVAVRTGKPLSEADTDFIKANGVRLLDSVAELPEFLGVGK